MKFHQNSSMNDLRTNKGRTGPADEEPCGNANPPKAEPPSQEAVERDTAMEADE
jgi:hypothetical protein